MGRYLGKVMVAGSNPARGSISLSLLGNREPELREKGAELLSETFFGLSKRLIVSFRAFSAILEMFSPYFLDFSTNSGGSVMLIVALFPLSFMLPRLTRVSMGNRINKPNSLLK